ncbi:IclR family transcriptional regulator [Allopusillimonas ginsengisoli]|uniref:IclR family transcriptional regulator n=1 Tax=Allopusillimonas ginsengisoli TaxID=453575 RepID=UPI00101F983D|nr:IclR family transcriptional regulator [Allopusillimonas ginsengisoli]TEA76920.1 IclR family transcriptional regulator [Allopusillimonas ginsengisoli]
MEIRQVANALELLEYFADRGRPATLAEIAKHFDWPRSSTFNLLGTLANRGYLYEPRAREGYYPSPSWGVLIQKIDRAAPVPSELQDLIVALRRRTDETAVLAGISSMHAVFIATAESSQAIRYAAEVGKLVPIHATGTGRALLSQLSEQERNAILRRAVFKRYTHSTLLSVDAVEKEIRQSLERGYFEGAGEFTRDLGGIALPLQFPTRHLALLVAGPRHRVHPRQSEILEIMREEISRHIPANA